MADFELGEAQQKLYDFFWNDFCDWYIEMAKVRLRRRTTRTPPSSWSTYLSVPCDLLHPFMPFVTEEIWQNLTSRVPVPGSGISPSIMVAEYPQAETLRAAADAEAEMGVVMQTIRAVRNMRAQLRIPAAQKLEASIESNALQTVVEEERAAISVLARVEPLRILDSAAAEGTGRCQLGGQSTGGASALGRHR